MPDDKPNNVNPLLNIKDSRWLQLEVCREFQRGQCSRSDTECKFAHPPAHVEIQNGRVTACYDSIKGRCSRENPKCKYLHPPQHLKDQLLINGRNNLVFKNLLASQLSVQMASPLNISPHLAAVVNSLNDEYANYHNYTTAHQSVYYQNPSPSGLIPSVAAAYNPFATYALNTAAYYPTGFMSASPAESLNTVNLLPYGTTAISAATLAAMQKAAYTRAERVDTAAHALVASSNHPYASITASLGKKRPLELDTSPSSSTESLLLAAAALNSPVNKRAAIEKGGVPVIQPVTHPAVSNIGATFHYPQFTIPGLTTSYIPTMALTGQPPTMPRF